ncbi:MAG: ABC transporter substrate-binding protein, partial [Chloroflexi bacterium]|nr:ABC transporter substrate-binding protein [Chloroflexota bacterium]
LEPGLATEWSMDKADGTQWTFKLREGIPFRSSVKEWGVFKAQDVVHSVAMIVQPSAIATDTGLFRGLYGKTEEDVAANIETPDDNTVVFNLLRPEAELPFVNSAQNGNLFMYSKDQFDAEGVAGYEKAAAGTGPWVFTDRELGSSITYRRVEDHYRKTAEFEEFRILRVPEAATRLAQLLTGEVQVAEINRDLHSQATSRGKKVLNSQLPSLALTYVMGGVFQPYMETYDPTVPELDVRVREAMNRAVNRKEIRDTLLGGQGTDMPLFGFHPSLAGWNPRWQEEFDAKYGYDPVRARELLKEAGYPNGFDVKSLITSLPGTPEMITMAEAIVGYLGKVGINAVGEEVEWARFRSDYYVPAKTHNTVAPIRGSFRPPKETLRIYHISGPQGFFRIIVDPKQEDLYKQVQKSVDFKERDRLQREIGDILFDGYATIPIAWLPGQLVVDPEIVAEFIWPGNVNASMSHIEYVKPVTK